MALCEKPFLVGSVPYPCGGCFPCRIRRRRSWAGRLLLEAEKHAYSSFVTLTFSDRWLPFRGSLVVRPLQRWVKRLRKAVEPAKLRYYLVGEYGDRFKRPHYHAVVFGLESCRRGGTVQNVDFCCSSCELVGRSWPYGRVDVGPLTEKSASYVAGYVTEKLKKRMLTERQWRQNGSHGRYPEFARMSLRPGIGAGAMDDVARALSSRVGVRPDFGSWDVPHTLMRGVRQLGLGRYLRRRLRVSLGGAPETPLWSQEAYGREMSELLCSELSDPENSSKPAAQIIVDRDAQKLRNVVARHEIFDSKRSL